MIQEDGRGVGRIKQSTGFTTNSKFIADKLAVACKGKRKVLGGEEKKSLLHSLYSFSSGTLFPNRFSSRNGREISSSVFGQTRGTRLYLSNDMRQRLRMEAVEHITSELDYIKLKFKS